MLGLTMAGRAQLVRWPRFAVEDVHRVGGLLVGSFVVLHVVTIALDSYLPFPLATLVVPGLSSYRPIWVALGIVAAELLLALAFTNRYRDRLVPYALWRRAHYLNFAVWLAATVHGLGTGTDRGSVWLLSIYTVSAASVATGIALRFLRLRPLALGAGLATAGLVVWIATGPLHVSRRPFNSAAANFSGSLHGHLDRVADPSLRYNAVMVTGVGGGRQQVWFRADVLVDLHQAVRGNSFELEYLPSGRRCSGVVTLLGSLELQAICRTPAGLARVIDVQWQPSDTPRLEDAVITSRNAAPGVAERAIGS
jgi:methionine sulfoxide reductase heme-binding subunit